MQYSVRTTTEQDTNFSRNRDKDTVSFRKRRYVDGKIS